MLGKGPRPMLMYPKGPSMAEPTEPLRFMAYTGQYYSWGDPANRLREDNTTYTYLLSNPIQAEES